MMLIDGETTLNQAAGETERYTIDPSPYLTAGETAGVSVVSADSDIAVTVESPLNVLVVSPSPGFYRFELQLNTSTGRVRRFEVKVQVK